MKVITTGDIFYFHTQKPLVRRSLIILCSCLLLASCGSSKYFIASNTELNNLSSLLKKLDKEKNDQPALRDQISDLYTSVSDRLLNDIEVYQTLTEPDRWEKMVSTYNMLNKMSDVINKSKAGNFVHPTSYHAQLQKVRQDAAANYYDLGRQAMEAGDKFSFRDAYYLYSKANEYYPGYKDVKRKMDDAWRRSVLNVIINPVTDQSTYYAQMTPNRFGNSFNSDLLQRSLIRDLGGDFNKNAPAKFFADREAYMANIDIDWIVDITWTRLDIPFPLSQTTIVERTKKIETGKDSLHNPIYQTVTAKVRVTRRYFSAGGEIECRVTDAHTRDNVDLDTYHSQIDWSEDYATFEGDSRALTDVDRVMINNKVLLPTRQAILLELYEKIYPQLKNGIYHLVQ